MSATPEGIDYIGKDELVLLSEMTNYAAYVGALLSGPIAPGSRVVDFGAGFGAVADQLRPAHDVVCIEVDSKLRRALSAKGYEVFASLGDLTPGSVDAIVSSNVLEHIEDDVAALRAMHEILRPGGIVTLYLPALPALWTSFDDRVGHHRRYTRATVSHAATQAGFEVRHTRYADAIGAVLAWVYGALGTQGGELKRWQILTFDRVLLPVSRCVDTVLGGWFGKNVFAICVRPAAPGADRKP